MTWPYWSTARYTAPDPVDFDIGFVDGPPVARCVPREAGGVGKQRGEPLHPSVHRDVVDLDAAFGEQLLDVAVGQPVAQLPAHLPPGSPRPGSGTRRKPIEEATNGDTVQHSSPVKRALIFRSMNATGAGQIKVRFAAQEVEFRRQPSAECEAGRHAICRGPAPSSTDDQASPAERSAATFRTPRAICFHTSSRFFQESTGRPSSGIA
jgi:hypothetical protein